MRELYIGFYKKLSYQNLIYISLAELISKEMGFFHGNKLKILRNNHYKKNEKKILNKVYLHNTGKLFQSELEQWFNEIKNVLIEQKYLHKHLV